MYEYDKDSFVDRYTKDVDEVGLWHAEECIFDKYVSKTAKILDIGCGAGRTSFSLYNRGYINIIGVDLSHKLINNAKRIAKEKSLPIEFMQGDATNLSLDSNKFDCVFFSYNGICTIRGYSNRCEAISEFYRVLKNDGILILTSYDRSLDKKYESSWPTNVSLENRNNYEYGDLNVRFNDKEMVYTHIGNNREMEAMMSLTNFVLMYKEAKSKITQPYLREKGKYGETYFYIYVKKEQVL